MYARRLLLSAVIFAGVMTMGHSDAFAQGSPLFAVLNGGNEVSPTGQARAGDLDSYGSATITFSNITPTSATLCFAILVSGITPATAAHIHQGRSGVNGGILVNLIAPVGNPGRSAGCVAITSTVLAQLRAVPAEFYVNVHNTQFPNGALRGQLF